MDPIFEHSPELADVKTRAVEVEGEGNTAAAPARVRRQRRQLAVGPRPHLRRRGRAAVALDCPGFGSASTLSHEGPVVPQLDAFVEAAVRRFAGPEGIVVVGNSLGGVLAIRAAQRQEPADPLASSRSRRPASTCPPGSRSSRASRFCERSSPPRCRSPRSRCGEVVGRLYRARRPSPARGELTSGWWTPFTTHIRTKDDAARILATGRRLLPELSDPFELERVSCPVLLVWGDRDRMVKISGADRVLREGPRRPHGDPGGDRRLPTGRGAGSGSPRSSTGSAKGLRGN